MINDHYTITTIKIIYATMKPRAANLGRVATLTARSVLRLTTGSDEGVDTLVADQEILADLVDCFIYDTNCTLFKSVGGPEFVSLSVSHRGGCGGDW